MINKTRDSDLQPFSGLTPEVVLDAAAAFGLAPDGRLFALNSYENRVYQLGSGEGQLVLKFYRPRRWTDAQIVEEHQFTSELAAAELAVAAPLAIGGETLLRYHEFRFAAFPWMRGRSPELDAPEARQILGRSVARLHQVGAVQPFAARPRIGIERLGWEARSQVLASELLPDALRERYVTVSGALLERVSEAFTAAAGVREIRLHGDCHLGNLLWNEHGPVFVGVGGAPVARSGLSARLPVGSRAALLGGVPAGSARADRRHRRAPAAAPVGTAESIVDVRTGRQTRYCPGGRARGRGAGPAKSEDTAMRPFARSRRLRCSAAALGAVAILGACSSGETPGAAASAARPSQAAQRKSLPSNVLSPDMVSAVSAGGTGAPAGEGKFEPRTRPGDAKPDDLEP